MGRAGRYDHARGRTRRRVEEFRNNRLVSTIAAPAEVEVRDPAFERDVEHDRPWVVIVWNDPINLMSYVTLVFQRLFGYSLAKATQLMLQVHHEGKAVVSSGNREKSELDVARLHAHGLWATMQQD
jgi:ATP-dependent Clp protease adaptor protein ClpS